MAKCFSWPMNVVDLSDWQEPPRWTISSYKSWLDVVQKSGVKIVLYRYNHATNQDEILSDEEAQKFLEDLARKDAR